MINHDQDCKMHDQKNNTTGGKLDDRTHIELLKDALRLANNDRDKASLEAAKANQGMRDLRAKVERWTGCTYFDRYGRRWFPADEVISLFMKMERDTIDTNASRHERHTNCMASHSTALDELQSTDSEALTLQNQNEGNLDDKFYEHDPLCLYGGNPKNGFCHCHDNNHMIVERDAARAEAKQWKEYWDFADAEAMLWKKRWEQSMAHQTTMLYDK